VSEHDDVSKALRIRGGFELVTEHNDRNQLRLMGRVPRAAVGGWLLIVRHLLLASDVWSVDVSKQYFIKGGKLVFGWRVLFQFPESFLYDPIVSAINSAPKARIILEEQPLMGARSDRNVPNSQNNGRGAQSSLNATIGPAAIRQLGRR